MVEISDIFLPKKCYNEFRIFDFSLCNTFYRIGITTDLSCLLFSSNIRTGPSPSNNNFPVIPDALAFMIRSEPNDPAGGGYSTDAGVGRCGWDTQTLTLFKTEISHYPTSFKTVSRFFETTSKYI